MNKPPIAIIGAGTMGTNIALNFAAHGHRVALFDTDAEQLTRAVAAAQGNAEALAAHGLLASTATETLARIGPQSDFGCAAGGADLVVEAVPENLPLKRRVFAGLESVCRPETLLASNTSTFMPSKLAEGLAHPRRFLVMHYWNPAHLMPLVEVVPHSGTKPAIVARVTALLEACGKCPVLVRAEVPGFIGNRLAFALQREAMALVAEGVATPEDIDLVTRAGFGRRIPVSGIFATADLGGLDVYAAICDQLFPGLSQAAAAPAVLRQLVSQGHLGVKSGQGWYRYTPDQIAALRAKLSEELILRAKQNRNDRRVASG